MKFIVVFLRRHFINSYNGKRPLILLFLALQHCLLSSVFGQHSNELYNNGAIIHINNGAEVNVLGDMHMYQNTGLLHNDGNIVLQGNAYSDNQFQQRGTGTLRFQNSKTNIGERQFISGSYAVRGGTAQLGVDDGSFYNIELNNDQGIVYLVGTGLVADVRNSIWFWAGKNLNKIYTHDIGITGTITHPVNGSSYSAIFGMMNPSDGPSNFIANTALINGNMSSVDQGYVQGKLRRAISNAGGDYQYPIGLEPSGPGAQRGFQYARLGLTANSYDVITGYFESGSSNAFTSQLECSGETMNYFGGTDHGQWVFTDINNLNGGTYEVQIWPQDDNFITSNVWAITKDNSFQGTANQCGVSPISLIRGGFTGSSEFSVSSTISALPIELLAIHAIGINDHINISWSVASELNVSHYEVERSEDGIHFDYRTTLAAVGNTNSQQTYSFADYDVKYFQDYYYRVRNVDFNGSFDYTSIVTARIEQDINGFNDNLIDVYPNPATDNFVISILSNYNLEFYMSIYNMIGQVVQQKSIDFSEESKIVKINVQNWETGVYTIQLIESITGNIINKRIVKH